MHQDLPAKPIPVWTMAGKSTLWYTMDCLRSLLRNSKQLIEIYMLSDGTLTDESISAIESPGIRVIRPEKDFEKYIESMLSSRPELRSFRSGLPIAKKLIDLPLLATQWVNQGEWFRYIDSDIYFVRPFDGLFEQQDPVVTFLESPDAGVHIHDICSIRSPMLPFLNSGIIVAVRPDLGYAEEVCRKLHETWHRRGTGTNPWLWEQTVYSYLYANMPQQVIRRSSVYTPRFRELLELTIKSHRDHDTTPVAYHLVSGYKHHISALVNVVADNKETAICRKKVCPRSTLAASAMKLLNGLRNRFFAPGGPSLGPELPVPQ